MKCGIESSYHRPTRVHFSTLMGDLVELFQGVNEDSRHNSLYVKLGIKEYGNAPVLLAQK